MIILTGFTDSSVTLIILMFLVFASFLFLIEGILLFTLIPHIHVYYQNFTASIDIQTSNVMSGNILPKQLKLIYAWIEIHFEELMADWQLCQNGEKPFSIEPLR